MNIIFIDNIKVLVPITYYKTIFQLCTLIEKKIPHFCYNTKLVIAGNCRICLVEVKGLPKPIASCATPVSDNMVIYTKSPLVLKARENVIEFLLINHPLDCPVCDQAGECDLQEFTLTEGKDISRFFMQKRGVEDKIFNSLVITKMTRCIHCTKCVRLSFLLGVNSLGVASRGYYTEIFDYGYASKKREQIPLYSNIIDICPVNWFYF